MHHRLLLPTVLLLAGACGGADPTPLEPGRVYEAPLAGGERRVYELELPAGRFLTLVAESSKIDLAVALHGPDGQPLAELESPATRWGEERLTAISRGAGTHRVIVRGVSPEAPAPLSPSGGTAGRYELSLAAPREATESDRPRIRADELHREGLALSERDTNEPARARFEEALVLWRQAGDPRGEARTRLWLGIVLRDLRLFEEAEIQLREALDLWEQLEDPTQEAETVYQLGVVHLFSGRLATARETFDRGLGLWRQLGDRHREAKTLYNLGYTSRYLAALQQALERYSQALDLFRKLGDRNMEATTLNSRAVVYQMLGDSDRAVEGFAEALRAHEELGNRREQAATLSNIGWVHHQVNGDPATAAGYFERAVRIAEAVEDIRRQATYLSNLSRTHLDLGDARSALRHAERGRELSLRARNPGGEALNLVDVGLAHLALGATEAAVGHLEEALRLSRSVGHKTREAEVLHALARVRRREGRLDLALDAVREALEIIEQVRTDIEIRGLRTSFLTYLRPYYELEVTLLAELARRRPGDGFEGRALEVSERMRARGLLEMLVAARVDPRHRVDPAPLSADEIRRQVVDRESLLLEYILGEESGFLFAVTSDTIEIFDLPPRGAVEDAVRGVYGLLSDRFAWQGPERHAHAARYRRESAALSETLLGPVAEKLSGRRLLVVGDGALHYLPFAALPAPDGDAAEPLVVAHEIVHLPSASVSAVLRRQLAGRTPAASTLAVLADPVFQPWDERLTGSAAPADAAERDAGPGGFRRLRHTRAEAEGVAALVPPSERLLALDFAASRTTATSSELADYRIVHFATHGVLDSATPELSGLVLSLVDEEGRTVDGFLRLQEIYRLELNAELVVLSACRTGLGKAVRGEGLVGPVRGFFNAGARSVVASLWQIEDEATAPFMEHFYQGLLGRGLDPADALRRTQIAMLRGEIGPAWRSPYHWAAFVLQGDWHHGDPGTE